MKDYQKLVDECKKAYADNDLSKAWTLWEQINDILLPYRTKTKHLNIPQQETEADKEEIKQNCIIEFWCSLKSGERKTIISWFLSMIKMLIKHLISGKRR